MTKAAAAIGDGRRPEHILPLPNRMITEGKKFPSSNMELYMGVSRKTGAASFGTRPMGKSSIRDKEQCHMKNTSLASLQVGQQGTVTEIEESSPMGRRLRDMGLVRGTPVRCLQLSPLGDPAAYLIRGAVIALRRADSRQVRVAL